MIFTILFSIIYFLLFGFVTIQGVWAKVGIGEKPLIYESEFIQGILSLAFIVWIVFSVLVAVFYNWKLILIIFIVGLIIGRPLLYRISETLFIIPIVKHLEKYK